MSRSVVFADDFERAAPAVQTLFRSLGTDATGTLNAWTTVGGSPSIAANVVTLPAGAIIKGGHPDWTDIVWQQRFLWVTGQAIVFRARAVDANNTVYSYLDGANVTLSKIIGGVFTGGVSSAVALVNNTQYWSQFSVVGTTFTAKVFADNAGAINLGSQIGATVTRVVTDPSVQSGQIGLDYGAGASSTLGGAFANVCQVTGPVPAGWTAIVAAGEPALAWSPVNPYAGTYSASVYNRHSSGQGYWAANGAGVILGLALTASAQLKGSGAPTSFGIQLGNGAGCNFAATANGSWNAYTETLTVAGSSNLLLVGYGAGTFYFDNVALYSGTPVVTQPTILRTGGAGGRSIAQFGNLNGVTVLPNGQGYQPAIDLNDYVTTLLVDYIRSDDTNRQIGLEQLLYRGRSLYTSDDFGPRAISLPMTFLEDAAHPLGGFLAALEQAGEQELTFDNATYIAVKYKGITGRIPAKARQPLAWNFNLELIAAEPWFKDLVPSALLALTLTVDAGQAFVIPYQGTVRCADPVWTLQVPASNGVAINSMVLQNLMSLEALTVNFLSYLAIPAATARTITIDCGASTVVDDLGHAYDISGTFPNLFPAARYPVADQMNPFSVAITPASGSTAGLTLACAFSPRWKI